MNGLTHRQRIKINASLAAVHAAGDNPRVIQADANAAIGKGQRPAAAYEAAVAAYIAARPHMHAPLAKLSRLIDASDNATVAQYDRALASYMQTGDDAALQPIEAMFHQDSIALSVKEGTLSAEDAAGAVNLPVLYAPPPPQRFAFQTNGNAASTPPANNLGTPRPSSAQPLPGARPAATVPGRDTHGSGVRAPGGAKRFAETLLVTSSRESPYAGMNPAQIKAAMAADYAGRGVQE